MTDLIFFFLEIGNIKIKEMNTGISLAHKQFSKVIVDQERS